MSDVRILEIDTKAFKENCLELQKYIGASITIMPVMKANAYGTYINKRIELIKDFEIIGVANAKEGEDLRKTGYNGDIFILNQPDVSEIETIIKYDLTIGICRKDFLEKLNQYNKKIKIHIEIETGMGRTGIYYEQIEEFLQKIGKNIIVEGIYSHLSSADTDMKYTKMQIDLFCKSVKKIESTLGNIKYKHISSSNGIINVDNSKFNLVRPGMILYGYKSEENIYKKINIKPISKLKAKITFIKYIEKGFSISYEKSFTSDRKMKIATIPIGYADGIMRKYGNNGYVIIRGKKAKILGNICMDSIMVDVSNIPEVTVGDYAYLWDNENITLEEFAKKCDTINYEILSTISDRVERRFI